MNVFYLSNNPRVCAEYHCDKHVVKMIIEYAQLLSTTHRVIDGNPVEGRSKTGRRRTVYSLPDSRDTTLYLTTHINHPSTAWVRQSSKHYDWLYSMWTELLAEYTTRYSKYHACGRLADALKQTPNNLKDNGYTDPPPAMPDHCKIPGDVIGSYRKFYITEKSRFATWKTQQPEWFVQGMEQNAHV
jgi:hypothetical protein